MSRKHRTYTQDFKREAVRLMETGGKPVSQLARELGLNDGLLYRWRNEFGSEATPTTGGTVKELEAELKRLQRENEVLRQERDILKKAMSIVSRSQA
jgi:transposase